MRLIRPQHRNTSTTSLPPAAPATLSAQIWPSQTGSSRSRSRLVTASVRGSRESCGCIRESFYVIVLNEKQKRDLLDQTRLILTEIYKHMSTYIIMHVHWVKAIRKSQNMSCAMSRCHFFWETTTWFLILVKSIRIIRTKTISPKWRISTAFILKIFYAWRIILS